MLATTSSATTIFSLNRIDTIKRNVHVSHDKGLGTAPLKAYKCFTTNQNTQILQLWLERNTPSVPKYKITLANLERLRKTFK